MRRWLLLGVVLLPLLALTACGGDGESDDAAVAAPSGSSSSDEVTVELAEQNGSGETGTATLTAMGDRTRVVLAMTNRTTDSQPAHIHEGSCENLDPAPLHGLLNVQQGESVTVVDAPLSELTAGGLAINVHESDAMLEQYVACGNLGDVEDGDTGTPGGDGY